MPLSSPETGRGVAISRRIHPTRERGHPGEPFLARAWRLAAPVAGPAAIVAVVAVILHDYVLGWTATQAADPLSFFLPSHCFLGTHLAGGDVPLWNPHVMAGVPFAADPQSGWMNLSAMLLYTALPCHVAFGWYIVLNPVVAGLGMYGFLRLEGLSRAAATTGGLALALPLAGSSVAPGSLPFSASLAWTAVLLAAGSGYRRAAAWPSRLLWLLGVSVAWGQLAAAHLSIGLILGTGALAASLGAGLVADVRAGRRTMGDAAVAVALLAVALPAVNAAILLPRLLYLPRTTLGLGYARLETLSRELTGTLPASGALGQGLPLRRPVAVALAPGWYLGAALALVFVPFVSRARRRLGLTFATYGALSFALASAPVIEALGGAGGSWLGSLYLHVPSRFLFGLLVALPVLAAVGLDTVREGPARRRWALPVALAAIVWVALPLWWSGRPALLPAAGVAVGAALVVLAARRPRWAVAIPAVVAVQLTVAGAVGHGPAAREGRQGAPGPVALRPLWPPAAVDAEVAAFLRPGPVAGELARRGGGRYLSIDPPRSFASGYRGQLPGLWGLLASQQSMVFGLEEAQGYNPAQSPRFWSFVRASDPKPIAYARAWFLDPPPAALDLLQVEWVVASDRRWVPASGATEEARQGIWSLFRIPGARPRASVVPSWSPARDPDEALRLVTDPGFDPSSTVILEEGPGTGPPGTRSTAGRAEFRWLGTDSARVEVDATAPSVVLIRNAYDQNWRATVDGRPAAVLAGDLFLQAVAVPAGRHTILLRYEDPAVWWGLWVSVAAAAAVLAAAWATRGRSAAPALITTATRRPRGRGT